MKPLLTIVSRMIGYSLLVCTGLFNPSLLCGQGLYNTSSLYVGDVNLYVEGEISNSGTLINEGLISFTDDWGNPGTYLGEGTLQMNGNGFQTIAHNDQDIHSLMINGLGKKRIKGNITITDEFHLTKGIVSVSEQDVLKLHRDAIIFGGSDVSFVDGPLTAEGKGYRFFPVGKNLTYAPIEFLNVKNNSVTYSVEVFENVPPLSVDNIEINHGLYWQRRDLSGTFSGSAVAVNFDSHYFTNPDKLVMLVGQGWENPFVAVANLEYSGTTKQLTTTTEIRSSIIVLGEMLSNRTENGFYFSTALSPNATNPDNRKVKIFGDRLIDAGFRFEVFNRWGELVYRNTSLQGMSDNGWDGRSESGSQLLSGPYPYRLTAVDKQGNKFEKKGVISIVY